MLKKLALPSIKENIKKFKTFYRIFPYTFVYDHKIRSKETLNRKQKTFNKMQQSKEEVFNTKKQIEKMIENKYDDQYVAFQDKKMNVIEENESFVENYYIPLRDEDHIYLKYFSESFRNIILQGGKLTLAKEIEKLRLEIPRLFQNPDTLVFILQEGKKFLDFMYKTISNQTKKEENQFNHLIELEHLSKVYDKVPFSTSMINEFTKNEVKYLTKLIK